MEKLDEADEISWAGQTKIAHLDGYVKNEALRTRLLMLSTATKPIRRRCKEGRIQHYPWVWRLIV